MTPSHDSGAGFPVAPSTMGAIEFINAFGGVYEHSPWIAEKLYRQGLTVEHDSVDGLAGGLRAVLERATHNQQLGLLLEHPELAGKAAVAGELTDESSEEQQRAGLDRCSKEEFEKLTRLNATYKDKFGFPFILAVRNATRGEILAEFDQRLGNDRPTEFARAVSETNIIARLRLQAMAAKPST